MTERVAYSAHEIADRMRNGTGVGSLLYGYQNKPSHHYIDPIDRFQKDYSVAERREREMQIERRKQRIARHRNEQLEREAKRWGQVQKSFLENQTRREKQMEKYRLGIRRTAHSNGLAYNPINLEYQKNPEGQKLKYRDQDDKIRGYVRAHNIDKNGNSRYNLINGQDRSAVEKVVPTQLTERFEKKLGQHYDSLKIVLPPISPAQLTKKY